MAAAPFSDTAYGLVTLACIGRTKTNAGTAATQSNESAVSSFDEDDSSTKQVEAVISYPKHVVYQAHYSSLSAADHTEPHLGDVSFGLSSPRLLRRMSTERILTLPQLTQTARVIQSQRSSREAGTVTHIETPPSGPSPYTPSDALSFTTIVSTIPPSYRTRRSEDLPRSPTLPPYSSGGVRHPQTPGPPSSFTLGGSTGRDSSRPRGPRTASTRARSHPRSRVLRIQDLEENAGQSRSARYRDDLAGRSAMDVSQNGKSGNYPKSPFISESEGGKPRKSIDGGVRLAGGPLGSDMNASSLSVSLPCYARSSDAV